MGHGCRVCAVLLLVAGMFGTAQAVSTYSGSLSYDGGGITGTYGNFWLASGTALDWSVNANGNGTYTYTYELQVPDDSKEISHMTIEVSPSFTSSNLLEVLQGTIADDQPDDYPKGGADPGMPSSLWGIKFEGGAGETDYDWTVSFISDRAPVWGDFYAVDGKRPGADNSDLERWIRKSGFRRTHRPYHGAGFDRPYHPCSGSDSAGGRWNGSGETYSDTALGVIP